MLEHELKSFSIVFSMADIHKIIGPTPPATSAWRRRSARSRRQARRIILLSGDPTENIYGMLTTKVVLKEGKVVVDKR